MAVQERRGENSLERYIAEVRAAWGDGKDPQLPFKVAALMQKLFASTRPDDPWMAELIQADWEKIGVKAKLVTYEWAEYRKRAKGGEHQAIMFGWSGDNGDPDNFFVPLLGRLTTHFSWRNGAAPTRRSTGQYTIASGQRLSRSWLVAG